MKYSIDDLLKSPFEKIKRISEDGYEYCSARDLYKLLLLREQMRKHNKQLAEAAKDAGINEPIDYAIFQNYGYGKTNLLG